MPDCHICCSTVRYLSRTPTSCASKHDAKERACAECWEAHLSAEVEQKAAKDIQCLFCQSTIELPELKRLARNNTVKRYNLKLQSATTYYCQARCADSRAAGAQPHDHSNPSHLFTCRFCSFATCTNCDRPFHTGETCSEYRTRVVDDSAHAAAEAATYAKYKSCPNCHIIFDSVGCGYMACTVCGYRFCGRCLIAWVGEGSAYLGGKQAHAEGCQYRSRERPSLHGLKRRFVEGEEKAAKEGSAKKAEESRRRVGRAAQVAHSEEGNSRKRNMESRG